MKRARERRGARLRVARASYFAAAVALDIAIDFMKE